MCKDHVKVELSFRPPSVFKTSTTPTWRTLALKPKKVIIETRLEIYED